MTGMAGDYLKQVRDKKLLAEARPRCHAFVTRFAERCQQAGVTHELREREGDPAAVICAEAATVDLVVLARPTHFHFETQDDPDADVLDRVVRECHRAVVSVPATSPPGPGVVVAYHAGRKAARALEAFALSGFGVGVPVTVLSIHNDKAVAEQWANDAVTYLQRHNISATASPQAGGDIGRTLLDRAHALDARMLVLGASSHSAFWEFFFGSVTEQLIDRADLLLFTHS
jgi:nucleotide-binding universal stress UspA family protein